MIVRRVWLLRLGVKLIHENVYLGLVRKSSGRWICCIWVIALGYRGSAAILSCWYGTLILIIIDLSLSIVP
jgi:hypothetical protein